MGYLEALVQKFNQNHDEHGRFDTGDGSDSAMTSGKKESQDDYFNRMMAQVEADRAARAEKETARPKSKYEGKVYTTKGDDLLMPQQNDATEAILRTTADHELGVIDSVTPLPDVGPLTITSDQSPIQGAQGTFTGAVNEFDEPQPGGDIDLSSDSNPGDFTHEYGHALDASLDPTGIGVYASDVGAVRNIGPLVGVMGAIQASPTYNDLGSHNFGITKLNYVASNPETFARGFFQYVATKSGDSTMMATLNKYRSDDNYVGYQWPDAEFAPISAEYDKLFSTPVTKYNENHDDHGRFAIGDGGTLTVSLQNPDGTWGGHFERPATAGKAATSDAKNREVAARITDNKVVSEDSINRVTQASYKTEDGKHYTIQTTEHSPEHGRSSNLETRAYLGDKAIEGKRVGVMDAWNAPKGQPGIYEHGKYVITYITTDTHEQRQGLATAMLEHGRANATLPVEHSVTLTDDGAKFTQMVKAYYLPGFTKPAVVQKDMIGSHIPQVIGVIPPIRPAGLVIRKPKAPKRAEVEVVKFNENHDDHGRFDFSADAVATSVHDQAVKNEPAITENMKELATAHGGTLVGLDFRVKTQDSLSRKIGDNAKANGTTNKAEGAKVSDSVRYTMQFSPEDYTDSTKSTLSDLKDKGYDLRVKNYWQNGDPYQGINVAAISPTGQHFELQFHTADSFHVKEDLNHPIYDVFRATNLPALRLNLWNEMSANASAIPVPSGVLGLPELRMQSLDE